MSYVFSSATDTGRARSNNEDSVAVDEATGVVVLADGMGGYNAGEVASQMATQRVVAELGQWLRLQSDTPSVKAMQDAMADGVEKANREIFNVANTNPHCAGMGTTLVVASFRQGQLLVGHVGDSRAYRLRAGRLQQLTKDHSLLQEQIDAGLITPEQAVYATHKNLVTRAVGVEDAVLLDLSVHDIHPGDVVLMCSDGLSDMLDDNEIAFIVAGQHNLDVAAAELVARANQEGGRDNISVILARHDGVATPGARTWWPFKR
jgi:PPM family protein phosphatase